jgi:hypothetical protein
MPVYWRVQLIVVVMASLSLVMIVIWALFVSRHTALTHISTALGHVGRKSLAPLATGAAPDFSWWQTIKASIWPNFGIVGVLFSAYVGGEVKRPARNQMVGMLAALAWCTGWMMIVSAVMVSLFGSPFFANLQTANPSHYGLSWIPGYEELAALGFGNGVAAVIMLALFSAWGITVVALNIAICSRTMFAWSLDRLVPAWFARVSARSHVPYNSILVMMLAGIVFTAALAWHWITVLGGSYGFFIAFAALRYAQLSSHSGIPHSGRPRPDTPVYGGYLQRLCGVCWRWCWASDSYCICSPLTESPASHRLITLTSSSFFRALLWLVLLATTLLALCGAGTVSIWTSTSMRSRQTKGRAENATSSERRCLAPSDS